MWASTAKFTGSCESRVLCIDWQESSNGEGGWLVTGCNNGTVGVSWVDNKEAVARRRRRMRRRRESNRGEQLLVQDGLSLSDEEESDEEYDEMTNEARAIPEDNLACTKEACLYKSHFILRSHTGEVRLVRWMLDSDRLASYDSWGRIIVWKNRANVLAYEFDIKTSLLVTDIQWSPCGYYLFLCGREGHVQLFSAINGMNLFSIQVEATSRNSKKAQFTCCSWNKPGTQVALGTENGEVVIVDPSDNGRSISTISMHKGISVQSLDWYGPITSCKKRTGVSYETQSLSAYLRNGDVMLFKSLASPDVNCSRTSIIDGLAVWNSTCTLLAVVGYKKPNQCPIVRFLNSDGYILFTLRGGLPSVPHTKLNLRNVKWGLNDSTLFQAWGCNLYSIEIHHSLPSLQFLARQAVKESLEDCSEEQLPLLPLPRKEIELLTVMKSPLIPELFDVCNPGSLEALMHPLHFSQRLHCKLESTDDGYLLKYEHLHHYIPLLQAKKKRGSLIHAGYRIEPAFDCNFLQIGKYPEDLPHHWASRIQNWNTMTTGDQSQGSSISPLRKTSILRQLRSAFKPGLSQAVVDVSSQQKTAFVCNSFTENFGVDSASSDCTCITKRPVLAEMEGNSIMNRFRFRTGCSLFQDGVLGSLNITTNYIKCQPRKLAVYLTGPGKTHRRTPSGNDDKDGREGGDEDMEEISLYSKDPDWNDRYQIYELDFGGRVSTDSIKNFQIERDGRVVMQFGRSYSRRFSLDFEAPFSPVQAFCVALACII